MLEKNVFSAVDPFSVVTEVKYMCVGVCVCICTCMYFFLRNEFTLIFLIEAYEVSMTKTFFFMNRGHVDVPTLTTGTTLLS